MPILEARMRARAPIHGPHGKLRSDDVMTPGGADTLKAAIHQLAGAVPTDAADGARTGDRGAR